MFFVSYKNFVSCSFTHAMAQNHKIKAEEENIQKP